ncbi:hypothetical protein Q9233_013816 [Columba guinea]|nr:hypothetical protein Q9233_013816 [Columba guinea]
MDLGDKAASSPHHSPPANPCPAPMRPAEPPTVTPAPEEVVLSQGVSPAQQCPPLSPQDLLALLQEHGPSTEGIFRLAAGERATRELREALDSGAQVQLESQPVHLLAAILKEFLRKIPSKLLQAELYQDWMSALHNTSRQERLAGLKESSSHQPAALQKFRAELDTGQVGHIFTCPFPLQVPPVTLEREHLSSASEESRLVQSSSHHLWSPPAAKVELAPRLLFVLFSLAPGGTNRRRRWLPWSFVWRRTSDAAEAAKPSGSGHTGVLFGRPLAALCSQDGSLPQLIQDLLALLQEHGPSTEGIFRLAAGERATRELREALDSGAQVQLESQPVHLLAAILKEFLRKIPSKLLQAELYQDWMSALHNTSRQERLAGLKELVQSSSHHLWSPPAAKVELAPRLDLLALLQEHGPSTEGIFRLAAGERATRELREALDSGAQVQLESQPVHLLAAILKEFLRKIPSKLLQAELYQDWMSALHNTSRQERLAGLKELVQSSSHHLWSPPAAKVELAPRLLFVLFSLAPGGTNRRRRWLPWSFVRRRTSDAAEAAKPSGSGHTGVLFGRPLAALCSQDGSLPQLIQDLLALLQEHGPSTEGIFRLAAGERATRELREALDSGAQVQLESQPVHLLAAILKEFLRKIPSKLLQAELYQDWMSALHNTSRQERLAGLKELVQSSSHHLWSPPAAKVELAPRLDLLALLQEHGPSTEGIFRLAAGERATRELREALDSGAQVQLESQPVHLLAAILKEFLRKIPSKLLQAELYQDWMSALHNTSRQERLAGLKE